MRQLIDILLAVLLLPVMTGCSDDAEEMVPNEGPFVYATSLMSHQPLYVMFNNQAGENQIAVMDVEDHITKSIPEYPYDLYRVDKKYYKMWFSIGKKDYNRYQGGLSYADIEGEAYANFTTYHKELESPMTFYLECEQIFRDKEKHVLVAEYEPSQEKYWAKCVRFTLDGVEYEVDDDDKVVVKL